MQSLDLVVRLYIRSARFSLRIDPAGPDPRLNTAENIRCQTVAHDHSLGFIKTGDPGKAPLKVCQIRLTASGIVLDAVYFLKGSDEELEEEEEEE